MLGASELMELEKACASFGAAWRKSYSHREKLTPKGHIVEVHVPYYARLYGTCGVFGEDGAEAIHVSDSACRRIVRVMRNPVDRHKAQVLHRLAYAHTPPMDRQKRKSGPKAPRTATAPSRAAEMAGIEHAADLAAGAKGALPQTTTD